MYRRHRNETTTTRIRENSTTEEISSPTEVVHFIGTNSLPSIHQHDVDQLLGIDAQVQKRESTMFLLHLKERKCLSQAVNEVMTASQRLFKHTIGCVQAGVNPLAVAAAECPLL